MTRVQITWTTYLTERRSRTVDLDDLPTDVFDAWHGGQSLTTEAASDDDAHESLLQWASEQEDEDGADYTEITDRKITDVVSMVHFTCGICDWSTSEYPSDNTAELAMQNHMRTTH